MKRIVLIVLLIAVVGGMVLVPIFRSKGIEGPATVFTSNDNLSTKWNSAIPIEFEVKSDEVKEVKFFYNDSLVHSFPGKIGKQSFMLNAGYFGLGTRLLVMESLKEDGSKEQEEKLIRILSDEKPEVWKAKIEKELVHNPENFTQGLEFDGTTLFESTGDPSHEGKTLVGSIDINTGEYTKKIGLDATYFGEGITILGDKIYQLTYTQGKCFVYDKNTLQLIKEFVYTGEGWGLCNDGTYLYMSNGSERITKRNPETFEVVETIEVYDMTGPIQKLNELEYVDGLIYANVWMTNAIVVFRPENGKVKAVINATELVNRGMGSGDVLNGIAYQKETGNFFVTGKYWSKMFVVSIQK